MKYYENNFVRCWTQGSYLQAYQEQDIVPCIICKVVSVDLLDCYTDQPMQHKISDILKAFIAFKHYWEKISAT